MGKIASTIKSSITVRCTIVNIITSITAGTIIYDWERECDYDNYKYDYDYVRVRVL